MELLLVYSADPNAVDCCQGNDSLAKAARADDVGLIKLLSQYRAEQQLETIRQDGEDLDAIIELL